MSTKTQATRIFTDVSHEHNHGTTLNSRRQDSPGMTWSQCQLLASALSAPALTGVFDSKHQSLKWQRQHPADALSLQAVDMVLMKCSRFIVQMSIVVKRQGAKRTDKTPVRGLASPGLEAEMSLRPDAAAQRWGSAPGSLGFKSLLKFSVSKLLQSLTGRRSTPIGMAICWWCNQNNSWSEYKTVTHNKGKTENHRQLKRGSKHWNGKSI